MLWGLLEAPNFATWMYSLRLWRILTTITRSFKTADIVQKNKESDIVLIYWYTIASFKDDDCTTCCISICLTS